MNGAGPRRRVTGTFFAAGFLATVVQVFLLRELLVNAAGDEAAIGVGLALWLCGIGVGARLGRLFPDGRRLTAASTLMAALSVAGPTAFFLGRWFRLVLAPPPGELPGVGTAMLLAASSLGAAGVLVGALFTSLSATAALYWKAAPGITRLYIAESLGSLAGGLSVTLWAGAGVRPALAITAASLGALVLSAPATATRLLGPRLPSCLAAISLALAVLASSRLDEETERSRFSGIAPGISFLVSADTPYQHLILGGGTTLHLYAGGQYSASFPDPWSSETFAHEAASLSEHPARVMALSGIARGPLKFMLRHPVKQIDLVEPDAKALEFLRDRLPDEDRSALLDPRVRILREDPRRHLSRADSVFDLILLQGSEPVTLLGARLASVEFFRECSRSLSRRGVLVMPVRTAPIATGGHTRGLAGSLFAALSLAFPVVRVTPGPDSLFLAGHDPAAVTLDPSVLAGRWRARAIESGVFSPELFEANFPPDRVREGEEFLKRDALLVPPGTDDRPVSFLHALARRQAERASWTGRLLSTLGQLPGWALAGLALLPSLVAAASSSRKTNVTRISTHAVVATGAAGMTLSLLLLFSYQACEGALYSELGLLTSVFMLGLAIGGQGGARHLSLRAAMAMVFGVTTAAALLLPILPRVSLVGSVAGLLGHAGGLLLAGVATGAVFPAAAAVLVTSGASAREAGGRLESADHLGAAVAALTAAVIFIPALGAQTTALLASATAGLALASAARKR